MSRPTTDHLLSLALSAVEDLHFDVAHSEFEQASFDTLLSHCATLPCVSVRHIPRSCRPLLADVLAREFSYAHQHGIWGYARVHIFAKAVLWAPAYRKKKKRLLLYSILNHRLLQWKQGNIKSLWSEASSGPTPIPPSSSSMAVNVSRALRMGREGQYSKAIQALNSLGTRSHNDLAARDELVSRHPQHPLPKPEDFPISHPALSVTPPQVLAAL